MFRVLGMYNFGQTPEITVIKTVICDEHVLRSEFWPWREPVPHFLGRWTLNSHNGFKSF